MQGKSNTETKYRQLYIAYAQKHTVAETARRYRISRKTVHKWLKLWDGTRESLESRSRRPHSSPRQHTDEELRSIRRRKKQCGWQDIVQAYQLSVERDGYSRSYGSYKNMAMKLKGAKGEEEENEEAKAIPASGVHRAKGADGREACTDGMHRKRAEILSIHGSRRVQPMDVSGDV